MRLIGNQKKQGSIVEAISQAILSGQIPAGTEMTQNELAESLGVSRMPVREALIILEYQGLIRRLSNNHVKAADLNKDYLSHIYMLCADIESDILSNQSDIENIMNTGCLRLSDPLSGIDAELNFHSQISAVCIHPLQKKILETMVQIYIPYALRAKSYDSHSGLNYIHEIIENLASIGKTIGDSTKDSIEEISVNKKNTASDCLSDTIHKYFNSLCEAAVHERSQSICSD